MSKICQELPKSFKFSPLLHNFSNIINNEYFQPNVQEIPYPNSHIFVTVKRYDNYDSIINRYLIYFYFNI